jgi:phosphoribosyl 1,2-cyclic phosphodiesterase
LKFASIMSHPTKGNGYWIETPRTRVFLDAGWTKRNIHAWIERKQLSPQDISAVLLSHSHDPHTKGLKFIRSWGEKIPIYAPVETLRALGIEGEEFAFAIEPRKEFTIGDLEVYPFPVKHHIPTMNYRIHWHQDRLAYITNTGNIDKHLIDDVGKCEHFLIESHHHPGLARLHGSSWEEIKNFVVLEGHLTNEDAAEVVARCASTRLQHIVLCNLSNYNDASLARWMHEVMFNEEEKKNIHVAPPTTPSSFFITSSETFMDRIKHLDPEKQQALFDRMVTFLEKENV